MKEREQKRDFTPRDFFYTFYEKYYFNFSIKNFS